MKRSVRYLALLATLLGGSFARADDRPSLDAYFQAQPLAPASPRTKPAAMRRVTVTSRDARRGTPTFLWAAKGPTPNANALAPQKPEVTAVRALAEHAELLGVPRSVILGARVLEVHDRGGPIVVRLQQEIDGIEVFRGQASILLDRAHRLVAASNNLHPAGVPGARRMQRTFAIGEADAVASAFQDLCGVPLPSESVVDVGSKDEYRLLDLLPTKIVEDSDHEMARPARVKKVYFQLPDRLLPAYYLELHTKRIDVRDGDAYAYVIAADDARVLYRSSLTYSAAFNYRVWAKADGDKFPLDGPIADFTPHPTGVPDGTYPAFIPPNLISMEGFNTNPDGKADPWLAANATQTLGNNVDAYADHYQPDGFSQGDQRASVTSPGVFDLTFDTSAAPYPATTQVQAAITSLFYTTNWLHDYWYESGFDEAAGNGQQSNYGRGGKEGDPMHAEAQDSAPDTSVRDNANMQAGADGASPRMQMYIWTGKDTRSLAAQPLNMSYDTGVAAFGLQQFDVSAPLALATPADACQALQGDMTGKVVLIDRGTCQFKTKAVNAANAGAVGMILADNQAAQTPPGMADGNPAGPVNIAAFSITQADGNALKAALANGAVTVSMSRATSVERDGTIDNSIVSHEWGHYLHHRLVNCGAKMCGAMSEGWADFTSLHRMLRPGDDVDGTYAIGQYATTGISADPGYFGIRRVAYSVDMKKDALTFKHIVANQSLPDTCPVSNIGVPDNTEVHNAGEIWATMMFEATVALIKRSQQPGAPYDFDGAKRRMADYVVAGMKLTPAEPTYTEQRDALLAASAAKDIEDMKLMAQAFAKRGLGSCAVSPPSSSQDNSGVVESFEAKPAMSSIEITLDDSVQSCDTDGNLDAQEKGKVTVSVTNTGVSDLADAEVTLDATKPGLSFPSGTKAKLAPIAPFATGKVSFDVALDGSIDKIDSVTLGVTVTSASTCTSTVEGVQIPYLNIDESMNAASSDAVEASKSAWTPTGDGASHIWAREQPDAASPNHVWHGIDNASTSDTALESPALNVSPSDPLVITFKHKHSFEVDPPGQGNNNYDGGVMEVSTDDGQTWQDISQWASAGYNGTISIVQGDNNPLAGRQGFINKNPSYPSYDTVHLDLGNKLAGKAIKVRFRIGADAIMGDEGWSLDDLSFQGITNKPFSAIVADQATCAGVPIANAGPDLVVSSGDVVVLDGAKSSDPDNDPLTYVWTEQGTPEVALQDASTVKASFTAPNVDTETTLSFQLTVSDGKATASDTVDVVVRPAASGAGVGGGGETPSQSANDGGSCSCSVVGVDGGRALAPLVAAGLLALGATRRRRRRRG